MDTTIITITRRSALGFGYNAGAVQGEHGLYVPAPTKPDYTGTFRQVNEAIDEDRTLASFRGGTYYTTAWFAKCKGQWCKILTDIYEWNLSSEISDGWATVTIEAPVINPAASTLGSVKTALKSATSAANGRKGGRPKKEH